MHIRRLEIILPLLVILTMLTSLVTPVAVFAAGEPPPPPGEKPSNGSSSGHGDKLASASTEPEVANISDAQTSAPLILPGGTSTPLELSVEAIANAGAVLIDKSGNLMPLATQSTLMTLSAYSEPYFKGLGGSSCDILTGFCTFATIQDAVNNYVALTGSGPIYAPSSWVENTGVDVNNVTKLAGLVWDGGGINQQYSPLINGNVTINSMSTGFRLDGFTIAGGIITNNTGGTLRLQNLEIKNTTGDGILVTNHKGTVALYNVYSHDNQGYGAYIDNSLSTGNVTIANSYFLNNQGLDGLKINTKGSIKLEGVEASNNDNGNGAELTFGLGATILNSTFNENHAEGLFVNNGTGILTLTNVTANDNENTGAIISESLDVNINASLFSNNSTGVSITSKGGNITMKGITSVDNPNGSTVDNSAASASKKVSITKGFFQGSTTGNGLSIISKGAITLNRVIASGNRDDGINIDNCMFDLVLNKCKSISSITITNTMGVNEFYNNTRGLVVNSGGSVTLAGVIATTNSGTGGAVITNGGNVTISKSQFSNNPNGYGLKVDNAGTISLDTVYTKNNGDAGALLQNTRALLVKTVTIIKSDFSDNYEKGLDVKARGDINLNNVISDNSTIGSQGASLDNCIDLGAGVCTSTGNINITNSYGNNSFSNNAAGSGLTVISKGSIKLTGVSATGNIAGYGAVLQNDKATSAKSVSVVKSDFSGNFIKGLEVKARGDITLNNVTADHNATGSQGASLDNCLYILPTPPPPLSPCKGTGNVNVLNTYGNNSFSNNVVGTGLFIDSSGIVTVNGTTASNNINGNGIQITNNYLNVNTKSVNINQGFFSNNFGSGVSVLSNGIITLNTVVGNDNNGFGALLLNDNSPAPSGGVIVSNKYGLNQFNNNHYQGLLISSKGAVTLTKVAANFNGIGSDSSGISIITNRNVTITCSSMQWNGKNGLEVELNPVAPYAAVLSLKSISASRNALGQYDVSLTTIGDPTKISLVYGWVNCDY
jgi:hypothetical protein